MKRAKIAGLIVCALLFAGIANAGITTVRSTLDYNDNTGDPEGIWFVPPDITLDHSPYYRHMGEDWGWTHSIIAQVPGDALGIQSATLEIHAWDVDANDPGEGPYEGPEIDIIYANGIRLGILEDTGGRSWKSTTFDLPPSVVGSLWVDAEVYIFVDIDNISDMSGHRVTLKYATLTVEYLVSGPGNPSRVPVYRFWSPVLNTHFYTAQEAEKEAIKAKYPDVWTYEGIAYHALPGETKPNSAPVYRFWSDVLGGHFYTISEAERDNLINEYPDVWEYEEIAWYAFPVDQQPDDTLPVYRFWSEVFSHHFYTMSEAEKDALLKDYADVWTYEGIAWYAYK
jgi:hypothetical protein